MSEDDLPEGWAIARLEHLIGPDGVFTDGDWVESKDQDPEGDVRLIQLADIGDGVYRNRSARFLTSAKARELRCTFLRAGDVLVARMPDPLGRACIFPGDQKPSVTVVDVCIIRPGEDGPEPLWLMHTINAPSFRQSFEEFERGTTRKRISRRNLARLELPVPPLAEQRRVIERVGAFFAQVNAARERLAKVAMIVKRFRQAVLAAACLGRLTEDWRDSHSAAEPASEVVDRLKALHEPFGTGRRGNAAAPSEEAHDLDASQLPDSWAVSELIWLCEPGRPITYGILKPGPDQRSGVPYVRIADYPNDRLSLANIRKTTKKIADAYRRSVLRAEDVLLAIRGTYGRVCRVPTELEGGNITQDTARLSIYAPIVDSDYVSLYLRSPAVQDRLKRAAKGVAVHGVNIGDVRALQVALPPREEQTVIVRRVGALFEIADSIEKRVAAATGRAAALPQAILANAFSGELVPTEADLARAEGRDYESASVLLERIRAERDSSPVAPRRARPIASAGAHASRRERRPGHRRASRAAQ